VSVPSLGHHRVELRDFWKMKIFLTRASDSNGSGASTNELGGGVNIPRDSRGLETASWELWKNVLLSNLS
jgi:hypothetical protein